MPPRVTGFDQSQSVFLARFVLIPEVPICRILLVKWR